MRIVILFTVLYSLHALSALPSVAHGPAPGEIYISTPWYYEEGEYYERFAILHSMDNGQTVSMQYDGQINAPDEMDMGEMIPDAAPGVAYLTMQGAYDLWRTWDYGETWEEIMPPTSNGVYTAGTEPGVVYRSWSSEVSRESGLYRSIDYGDEFSWVHERDSFLYHVGSDADEIYSFTVIDSLYPWDSLAVAFSDNGGDDFSIQHQLTEEEIGVVSANYMPRLHHGSSPGELYIHSFHFPEGVFRIYLSEDYAQNFDSQYEGDLNEMPSIPRFSSGSSPGVFYIMTPEIIYTTSGWYTRLHLFVSEDCALTFPIERIYDLTPDGIVAVTEGASVTPAPLALSNFPNPFNPETTLSFTLDQPSHVRLGIFNVKGQHVATLLNEHRDSGRHSIVWNAADCPSGVYFARLVTPSSTRTHRLLLLK